MRGPLVALAAAGLFGAGSALAQETPPDDGMMCVYQQLVEQESFDVVARVFLYDDTPEDDIAEAAVHVAAAQKDCGEQYGLTEGQVASIGDLGIYGAAVDYLGLQMMDAGATEQAVHDVISFFGELTEEELDKFFDADWRSDMAFYTKLKDGFVARGVPDQDESIDLAMNVLEIRAMADEAMFLFQLDELDDEESEG